MMLNFRINEYLELRLENKKTLIYVNGEQYIHCKKLIITEEMLNREQSEDMKSIDDLLEYEETENFGNFISISPEEEFWGHCSNLQAWYENDYRTEYLDSRIAFPLLKKLSACKDALAEKVFKQEIGKKFESGTIQTVNYLIENKYHHYLEKEELMPFLLKEYKEIDLLNDLEGEIGFELKLKSEFDPVERNSFLVQNQNVIGLDLDLNITEIPQSVFKLANLKHLIISGDGKISNIQGLKSLKKIKTLRIYRLRLDYLGDVLIHLKDLQELELFNVGLKELPQNIGHSKSLRILSCPFNKIKKIPKSINELDNLKILDLSSNDIQNHLLDINKLKKRIKIFKI